MIKLTSGFQDFNKLNNLLCNILIGLMIIAGLGLAYGCDRGIF
ncbi:MAG: hypothetical protein ACFFG0_02945 [Candidatus Thorarchaeota archaeon]